jgi:hypothetical protein
VSLVVIDTDVASTLLRRRATDALAGALAGHVLSVTFVTVGELTKWTLVRHWGPRSLDTMRNFLAGLVVLPYDQRVAAGQSCPTPRTQPGASERDLVKPATRVDVQSEASRRQRSAGVPGLPTSSSYVTARPQGDYRSVWASGIRERMRTGDRLAA